MRSQMKAIVGGIIAGLSFAIPIVDDGATPGEVLGIALAAIIGWQAVYWTTNADEEPVDTDENPV